LHEREKALFASRASLVLWRSGHPELNHRGHRARNQNQSQKFNHRGHRDQNQKKIITRRIGEADPSGNYLLLVLISVSSVSSVVKFLALALVLVLALVPSSVPSVVELWIPGQPEYP